MRQMQTKAIIGADPEILERGGVEEEIFERKMFVDTHVYHRVYT